MFQYGTHFFSAPTRGLMDPQARVQIGGQIAMQLTAQDAAGWELVTIVPCGRPPEDGPVIQLAHATRQGPKAAEPESHFMVVLRRMVVDGGPVPELPDAEANGDAARHERAEDGG